MPGLGITCGQLRREVGHFLGFDRDPANWSAIETQDVWDIIDSGLRQFYRPPRLEGEVSAHQWSFLRPLLYIQIWSGYDDYILPEDFAGLDGGLYFVNEDDSSDRITVVNEGRILQLRQSSWNNVSQFAPQYAAITPIPGDQATQQRWKLMLWPKPDVQYTLRCKYYARQDGLRTDTAVPLGASDHAETILASCLAAAESREDDDHSVKHQRFLDRLRASVDFDRRSNSPQTLGQNGDPGMSECDDFYYSRAIGGLVTLEAYPVGGGGEGEPPAGTFMATQGGEPIVTQDGAVIVPQ